MSGGTVCVGVPAQEQMWTKTTVTLLSLRLPAGSTFNIQTGTSLPAKSRNLIGRSFLESDHEYLLYMDSDMVIPPDTFSRLAQWDEPAVWALAYSRFPPYPPIPRRGGNPVYRPILAGEEGLVEVDSAGAGCLLLRRSLLESLEFPWFRGNPHGAGEDDYFCQSVAEETGRVLVDYGLVAKHVGATAVGTEYATTFWKRREEQLQQKAATP